MLSGVCLLLYSAGFVRIELKFNDHDQRLTAVEEVISQMKHGMADTWNKGIDVSGNCLDLQFTYKSCLYILYQMSFREQKNDSVLDLNSSSEIVTKYLK